jgi:PleD family two-component response regulator
MKRFVRELIQVADDALYKTKEQDKDRLVIES